MRGKAVSIERRAYWMARHESGASLTALSAESGIRREVLSRWWQRFQAEGLTGLAPVLRVSTGRVPIVHSGGRGSPVQERES